MVDSTEESDADFGFGFNDPNFSDRTLRLVIIPADDKSSPGSKSDLTHNSQGSDDESNSKHSEEKLMHVTSLILAAKSPFFRKLFSNGMRESAQQLVDLHIQPSEEAAVMDLLKFMYTGTVSGDTPSALLDVVMVAEKFEVPSCMKLCKKLLHNSPMTLESALLYLDTASTNLMAADIIMPLSDAAKKFVAQRHLCQEELLKLPLVGFEALLSSDHLQVNSENQVYDLMLKWVQTHFPDQSDEKHIVLDKLVRSFLRFPFLNFHLLADLMTSSEFDKETASKVALGALRYYKHIPTAYESKYGRFIQRAYKHLPLKVLTVDDSLSHPHCVVYLNLTREECESLYPSEDRGIITEDFCLGSHSFFLQASCKWVRVSQQYGYGYDNHQLYGYDNHQLYGYDNHQHCFGLRFTPRHVPTTLSVSCEIAATINPSENCKTQHQQIFTVDKYNGYYEWSNLFDVPWATFIAKNSPYFINGILRLRAEFAITS